MELWLNEQGAQAKPKRTACPLTMFRKYTCRESIFVLKCVVTWPWRNRRHIQTDIAIVWHDEVFFN